MVSMEAAARVTGALPEDEAAAQDHAEAHGGDRVAAALAAHGVTALLHLMRRAHLAHPQRRQGARHPDRRHAGRGTAVFAADAVARLTGVPGVAAVTAGPGHHQYDHRIEECAARAIARGAPGRRGADAAARARRAAGHRPAPRRRAACQAVSSRSAESSDLARRMKKPSLWRARACPARSSSSCPVDLLYDEAMIRQWYARGCRQGPLCRGLPVALLYLNRHLAKLFGGSEASPRQRREIVAAPAVRPCACEGGGRRALRRPSGRLVHRQPGASPHGARPLRLAAAVAAARRSGLSVGHGAGPARARATRCRCATSAGGIARGRLRAAGGRPVRFPARLWQANSPRPPR